MAPLHSLPDLPPSVDLETVPVWRALVPARTALTELKASAAGLPNPAILINTLSLQEALASSEIENIVTTQEEVLQLDLPTRMQLDLPTQPGSVEAKEVARYRKALHLGYESWRQQHRLLTERILVAMFQALMQRSGGYRQGAGTVLRHEQTDEIVYTPPQKEKEIIAHMRALEKFLNEPDQCPLDPLIKMALIHYQFESIHPFPDGNGRIGRILNVLYLVHTGLLGLPILYLSRAINRTKADYYRLLQAVRMQGAWEEWVIYMLKAVEEAATSGTKLVKEINELMIATKRAIRQTLPRIYSQDLLNNLFHHPYTRIAYLESDLSYGKQTARSYLKQLTQHGFVKEMKVGRNNYYINQPLIDLLAGKDDAPPKDEAKADKAAP